MSKKSKKNRNGNHNQNTPRLVGILPEHQSHAEATKVEAVALAARVTELAKPRVARGRRLAQVDPRSPSLRLTGAALIVATV